MAKKNKPRLPTEEEFLQFKPKRGDFSWETLDSGLIVITVPKFKGKIGNSLCKLMRKDEMFAAELDKIGSCIWKNCDGEKTVEHILKSLKTEFPKEKNINQRLILFLQQMYNLGYVIIYQKK